jgi:hypothetical protein
MPAPTISARLQYQEFLRSGRAAWQALALNPRYVEALNNLSVARRETGPIEAIAQVQKAVQSIRRRILI